MEKQTTALRNTVYEEGTVGIWDTLLIFYVQWQEETMSVL